MCSYRYHKALLEIENLRKLRTMNWNGIPNLLGACVHQREITYVMMEISAVPLCSGDGLSFDCSISKEMKRFISQQPNAGYSTLLWMSKVGKAMGKPKVVSFVSNAFSITTRYKKVRE